MGLLQKLLSTLGMDGSNAERGNDTSGETTVTVEHEPDVSSESAVKGTDDSSAGTDSTGPSTDATEPTTDTTESAESTESTHKRDETPDSAAETAETDAEDEAAGSDEPTDVLNGIGPAYAERLEDAGIENVADLAGADAAALAEETGLGEGRVANWIEQAKDY